VQRKSVNGVVSARRRLPNRAAAEAALTVFAVKYDKAVECVTKDRESLLTVYDLPAC
jgi:putative transposase